MAKGGILALLLVALLCGQFLQQISAHKKEKTPKKEKNLKKCVFNGVEYQEKQEVVQNDKCCECKKNGKFKCSFQTQCYQQQGCAHYKDEGCCPKCECKNAAGDTFAEKERWTNTVHGVCYECVCEKKNNLATCKPAKPCKAPCTADEIPDPRYCCKCGKHIPPTRKPPKKFKSQKEFEEYIKASG